jgi:alpha-N-acetylglucosaminidase
MLGPWLESAKAAAHTPEEEQLYEWNLRSQLTVWGLHPGGPSEIEDYANRQWAGLMLDYYRARCADS